MFQREYIDLNTIYKQELVSENYKINTIRLTMDEVLMEKAMRQAWLVRGLKPDFDYVRLIKTSDCNDIMMSDTPMERSSNSGFLKRANGDVIIFGLGLGLIIFPLLNDDAVKSITVVELYQDLIDIVEPIIKKQDIHNKVKIVQGDCFSYKPSKEGKFDTIYFDIWTDISYDNYAEQKKLVRKHQKYLNKDNPNYFIDAWLMDYYKSN